MNNDFEVCDAGTIVRMKDLEWLCALMYDNFVDIDLAAGWPEMVPMQDKVTAEYKRLMEKK